MQRSGCRLPGATEARDKQRGTPAGSHNQIYA